MDQVIRRVLRFDRFALDLARASLRAGDQEIHLRPKTFEVLRYLVENAGRLVSKQELYEAVWPAVAVTDDSLVQCIRELREKLGDDAHRLIRTVSRRGYMLDAAVVAAPPSSRESAVTQSDAWRHAETNFGSARRIPRVARTQELRTWGALATGLAVLGVLYFLSHLPALEAQPEQASRADNVSSPLPPRSTFKDCDVCPEMVPLPAGAFMMGSPQDELYRTQVEGRPRRIAIARPFAIGRFEITVDQFAAFVAETGARPGGQCRVVDGFDRDPPPWRVSADASFRRPGFEVNGRHPAGCINWHDAQAYAAWLRRRTGKPYRLPTEAEWEYAARAGTTTRYSFGDDATQLCAYAKFADLSTDFMWRGWCRAEEVQFGSMEVGRLKANPWGIFDMHGNVWEWVEDCWTWEASEIPADGSAFTRPGNCESGVIRGGSWLSGSPRLRSAVRVSVPMAHRSHQHGFRIALSLGE